MKKGTLIAAAAMSVAFAASVANAQEEKKAPGFLNKPVAAPSSALEIDLASGYNQGVGDITNITGDRVQDYSGAGIAGTLDIGYRATPGFSIGVYGQGTLYNANDRLANGTDVRDLTAGIQANFHFRPYRAMDPWLGIGGGYHGYWVVPDVGQNTNRQGLEIARVRAGADFRVSNEVALGPMIGAATTLFLQEKLPGDTEFHSIDGKRLNFWFFGGLLGRFDMAGTSIRKTAATAAR
jgi:hypothetical protein